MDAIANGETWLATVTKRFETKDMIRGRLAGMAPESAVRGQSGAQPARVLFVTGAGMSAESGLPTYRGVSGLYNQVSEHTCMYAHASTACPDPPMFAVLRLPHALIRGPLAPPRQPGSHGGRRGHRGCHQRGNARSSTFRCLEVHCANRGENACRI